MQYKLVMFIKIPKYDSWQKVDSKVVVVKVGVGLDSESMM